MKEREREMICIYDMMIRSVTVQIGRGTLYLSYFVCRAVQINRYAALSFMAASLTVGTLPLLYVPPTPSRPTHLRSSRYVARSLSVVAQWFSIFVEGGGERSSHAISHRGNLGVRSTKRIPDHLPSSNIRTAKNL